MQKYDSDFSESYFCIAEAIRFPYSYGPKQKTQKQTSLEKIYRPIEQKMGKIKEKRNKRERKGDRKKMIIDFEYGGMIFSHMGKFYYGALYDDSGRGERPRGFWDVHDSANTLEGQRHFLVDKEGSQYRILLHRVENEVLWWTENYSFEKILEGKIESPKDPGEERSFEYDLYAVMKEIERISGISFEGLRNPIPLPRYGSVEALSHEKIGDRVYRVLIRAALQGKKEPKELFVKVTQIQIRMSTETRIDFENPDEKAEFVWKEDCNIYKYILPIIEQEVVAQ